MKLYLKLFHLHTIIKLKPIKPYENDTRIKLKYLRPVHFNTTLNLKLPVLAIT